MKLQFNIRILMLAVVIWALPNAFFGWMIRAHPGAFPKGQAGQFFVGLNIALAFFAIVVVYAEVLHRYTMRGRTTAQIRAHRVNRGRVASGVLFIDALLLIAIVFWYYNRFFRSRGLYYSHLAVFLLVATVAMMVRNEILKRPARRHWTAASLTRLALGILGIAWLIGWAYFFMVYRPHLLVWGLKPWFPVPPAMLLMLVVLMVFQGALAVLMRVVEEEDGRRAGGASLRLRPNRRR